MCGGCKKNVLKAMTCYGSPTQPCVQQNARASRSTNSAVNSTLTLCTCTRSPDTWISYPSLHQHNSCLSHRVHQKVLTVHPHFLLSITYILIPCIKQNLSCRIMVRPYGMTVLLHWTKSCRR